jgi:acetylornithine deacetylase
MTQVLSARAILEHLVGFPTVSRDTNLPLIHWVADYLQGHGLDAHVWTDSDQPEKAALFAHAGPMEDGAIVLSGHTDVVPIDGQDWQYDPFAVTEVDGKLFGRGTCDMKGFDALAIWATVEATRRGVARPLQLALSFDEEVGCTGAPKMLTAMHKVLPKGATVIVGEPSMMACVTGHKGGQGYQTHVHGFEVHSSLADEGVSAVHEAARLIQWSNDMNSATAAQDPSDTAALFKPSWTSWHVGIIEGGTAQNIMAKDCQFMMGYRAVPDDDEKALQRAWFDKVAEVERGMQAVHPDTRIDVETVFDVPPLRPETDGAAERLVRAITGDNGTHVVSYGTEAGHFQSEGYSAVVCGPGSIDQAHQPDEFISVAQFQAGQDFLEELLTRLA